LAFLQIFIQTYPKYSVLPFTVTGESYAGHYIPAIANAIFNSNELVASNQAEFGVVQVNMVSIAIGNGLTDPLIQYEYYPDMVPFLLKKLILEMGCRLVIQNTDRFYLKKHVMK
jgi:cathepsin A (carboxypeptidase C)